MDENETDQLSGSSPEEDEDEVDVPVDEVIDKLSEAWVNERFAPHILPSKMDLAESLLNGVSDVRDGLPSNTKGDLLPCIQEMELDRINYLISSYARMRLRKSQDSIGVEVLQEIEDLNIYVNNSKAAMANLSEKEAAYANEFSKHSNELLNSIIKEMPANIQTETRRSAPQKKIDTFVFFEVVEKLEQVVFESDDEPMDLEVGSRHLMRFGLLVPLLVNGSIKLI